MKVDLDVLQASLEAAREKLTMAEFMLAHATNAHRTANTEYQNAVASFEIGVRAVQSNTLSANQVCLGARY